MTPSKRDVERRVEALEGGGDDKVPESWKEDIPPELWDSFEEAYMYSLKNYNQEEN